MVEERDPESIKVYIKLEDFEEALTKIKPSVSEEELKNYK